MRRIAVSLLMLLAVVLAACAPAPTATLPTEQIPVTGDTDTPEAATTEAPAETATEPATEPATTATEPATEPAGDVTLSISTTADVSEPFLVDDEGRSLYLFTNDTQNSGASTCSGDCLAAWPAVVVSGTPTAGTGVDAAMLGTITRDDGTIQATYNGWPLYYYVDDVAAGDILGQGMNDVWFLVSATGNAIQP